MTYEEALTYFTLSNETGFPEGMRDLMIDLLKERVNQEKDYYTYEQLKHMNRTQQQTIADLQDTVKELTSQLTRH